eukprot:2616838-Rhodomonas_salina.1
MHGIFLRSLPIVGYPDQERSERCHAPRARAISISATPMLGYERKLGFKHKPVSHTSWRVLFFSLSWLELF